MNPTALPAHPLIVVLPLSLNSEENKRVLSTIPPDHGVGTSDLLEKVNIIVLRT